MVNSVFIECLYSVINKEITSSTGFITFTNKHSRNIYKMQMLYILIIMKSGVKHLEEKSNIFFNFFYLHEKW